MTQFSQGGRRAAASHGIGDYEGGVLGWLGRRAGLGLVYIASIAALILLWELGSRSFAIQRFFPSPSTTIVAFLDMLISGPLIGDVAASMYRILTGFLIGSVAGFVIGVAIGASRILRYVLDPYVNFFRFVSGIAWIGFATLWFGLGEASKIAVVVYVSIFAVALNTYAGYLAIPVNRLRAAQSVGASRLQVFTLVAVPSCVHYALNGMRLGMGAAFLTVVAAEMVAARSGIGYMIHSSRAFMAIDVMFAGILTLGILGFAADKAFLVLTRVLFGRYRLSH